MASWREKRAWRGEFNRTDLADVQRMTAGAGGGWHPEKLSYMRLLVDRRKSRRERSNLVLTAIIAIGTIAAAIAAFFAFLKP